MKLMMSSEFEQCPRRLLPVSTEANWVWSTTTMKLACDFCGTDDGRVCIGGEWFPCTGEDATVCVCVWLSQGYVQLAMTIDGAGM